MKYLFLLLFCCFPVSAQSLDALNQRYGRPQSVTFEVRPGIYATVASNKAGEPCQIIVSPQLVSETLDYPSTKTMTSAQMTEIIDELVPVKERGERRGGAFANLICLPLNNCAGGTDNYERVGIFRNGGTDKERYAVIQFVRPTCLK